MSQSPPDAHRATWRVIALAALAVVVMAAPALMMHLATARIEAAQQRVAETVEVRAQAYDMLYRLREAEGAALMLYAGIDDPRIRKTFADNNAAVLPAARALAALTRGDPDQQQRIGGLTATLERRLRTAAQLAARRPGDGSLTDVQALALDNQITARVLEIIASEDRRLDAQIIEARRLSTQANVLRWSALAAQLLLLASLIWVWRLQSFGRMRAESESVRASGRAHAVLQTVREPIVLLDASGRVVMHNTAFAELYGVESGDAAGLMLQDVGEGAWSDPGMLQRLNDVLRRKREVWDYEQSQRTSDGVERTMLISSRQMDLPDMDDTVVLVLATDVTLRKVAEARMQELNRQLEGKVNQVSEVNRELEAFSYSVSHDLRAPLRHVAGFADKLGRHLGDQADDTSRHYLDVIGSSARRMSTLIDDLLVYSRLGRGAMRLQAVDMQSLAVETRAMLDANLASDSPGRRVEWVIAPMPILVADENMMRQVWLNLLGNAVKYSDRQPHARIEILHTRDADDAHHFQVRDNGSGFDMQYAGKLFGVFQRMHKASDYPGTGIGLASVRRVLQRHGGRIWAESTVDAGSTFHFVLPASLDSPSSASGALA